VRVVAVRFAELGSIGCGKMPDLPSDEYDSYAPHIVSLLERGSSDAEIAEYLSMLENETIGVSSGLDLVDVARRLRALVGVGERAT
jgi:hypothetical protein